jgi:hypothetical protein
MLLPRGGNGMFDSKDETVERNHLLRLLGKAILKLQEAAAANTEHAKPLGPVRAELVEVVEAVRDHTDASIPQIMLVLHRLGVVLDAMSDPVVCEARADLTSSVSMVRGLLRRE